jgi:alanine dehydrogenase
VTLLLSNADVDALITMPDAIDALESGYRDLANGQGTTRRRIDSFAAASQPDALFMLSSTDAIAPTLGVAAVRMSSHVTTWPSRGGRRLREKITPGSGGKPVGLILLFSTRTGEPIAILPDGAISVLRVGATSALGARYLAREATPRVAIIGTGNQAGGQLSGLTAVRTIESVRCYSPTPERRVAFASRYSATLGIPIEPAKTAEQAVDGADLVICATNSLEPVYFERWAAPGIHVSSIRPTEIEPSFIARADVTAVHTRDALSEQIVASGIDLPERHSGTDGIAQVDTSGLPQLTDLIGGRAPGRTGPDQISCFLNTIGTGFQFAALGALVVERALRASIGRELPTAWFTQD